MTKIYRMINRYLSQKCTSVNLFPKHNKWILSVYNLIIFSNFPQIKSALDEQLKCLVLKVSVEDILLWLSMHLKNIRFTKRMRANDLKEIWNIFRHYNLKQISYFTTRNSYTLCNVIQNILNIKVLIWSRISRSNYEEHLVKLVFFFIVRQ